MNKQLKPCPFCGGKAELRCFMNVSWVKCIKCEASTGAKTSLENTIKAWNRKTSTEGLHDPLEPDCFPLTVIRDRYNGTYSGGKYTAWNCNHWEVPKKIQASDEPCRNMWYKLHDKRKKGNPAFISKEEGEPVFFGVGNTIADAIIDLERRINHAID